MSSLWFAPDNVYGNFHASYNYGEDFSFNSSRNLYFYAKIYLDESTTDKSIPLLSILDQNGNLSFSTFVESGILKFRVYYGTGGAFAEATNPLPTGEIVEIAVSNSRYQVKIFINGIEETLAIGTPTSRAYAFGNSSTLILGGNNLAVNQASGLLILDAVIGNILYQSGYPPASAGSDTIWRCYFDDPDAPFKILANKNNIETELAWIPTNENTAYWVDGITPPGTGGGSGGEGAIIIPGNGNTTQVQGVITENEVPVARRVFAFTEALLEVSGSNEKKHAVINSVMSDELNGSYTLDTSPYEGSVILVAMDNYGDVWQPDTAYSVDDVIRPANFQGYVYYCTVEGISASDEPNWWFDTESVKSVGTAQFKAKPYSRPLAHAPIIPEILPSE